MWIVWKGCSCLDKISEPALDLEISLDESGLQDGHAFEFVIDVSNKQCDIWHVNDNENKRVNFKNIQTNNSVTKLSQLLFDYIPFKFLDTSFTNVKKYSILF